MSDTIQKDRADRWRLVSALLGCVLLAQNLNPSTQSFDSSPPSTNGDWLVVVADRDITANQQIVLNDHEFFHDSGFGFRRYSSEQPAAKQFVSQAEKRNVSPPFAMRVNSGGDVIGVVPLPDTDTAPLRKLMK